MGSACGKSASSPTVKNFAPRGAFSRLDEKTTRCPSGVQPWTMSGPGCHVSRRGSPPSTGTTYTSVLPPYWPENATQRPSGESCGFVSCPGKLVSRRASPPSRSTIQMSFAYENAMWRALTVGSRRSRVDCASRGAAASTAAATTNRA